MPHTSLAFLAELHAERLADSTWPNADPELPGEQAFVDTAQTLSKQPLVRAALPDIIQQEDLEPVVRQLAVYVGLLGEDVAYKTRLLDSIYQHEAPLDITPSLAWLTGDAHDQALTLLAQQTSAVALETLAERCMARGQESVHLSAFLVQGEPRYTGGYADQLFARVAAPPLIHLLQQRFTQAEDTAIKCTIAHALLHCHDADALTWLCSTEGILADAATVFAVLGKPRESDLEACFRAEQSGLDDTLLCAIADNLEYYGSPWSFNALQNAGDLATEPAVAAAFHRLMLNFFDTQHEPLFPGVLLLEETEQHKPHYQQRVNRFWTQQRAYVNQTMRPHRYLRHDFFDLSDLLRRYRHSEEQHYPLADLIRRIEWWTGQRYPFDPHALYSTQQQQLAAIQAQVDALHLESGQWYRWGKVST